MNTGEYDELFRYLMEQCCFYPAEIVFVDDVAGCSREYGISEPDENKPMKLLPAEGRSFRMFISEYIPDQVIAQRINALRIRSQLKQVSGDRADLLNTPKKKLAYLFLSELSSRMENFQDERAADDWAFQEMERLGFFRE